MTSASAADDLVEAFEDARELLGRAAESVAYSGDREMELNLEVEREEDGRWVAEVPELPGVLVYGSSADEAMVRAEVLALRVLAEQIEQGEARPEPIRFVVPAA